MPVDPQTAAAVVLYVGLVCLPGLAVLELLGTIPGGFLIRLGLATAVGVAIQPLVYLWADTLGLGLGPGFWWAVLVLAAAWLLARGRRRTRRVAAEPKPEPKPKQNPKQNPNPEPRPEPRPGPRPGTARGTFRLDAPQSIVLAAVGFLSASRWWAARDLVAPMWGDSVHHAMIVALFTRHGGLVADWRPFAPLSTFTYHFGLHAGVASLAWLADLPPERALLIAGQALSVLGVLSAYALATGLTGRPWAGLGAALAAGGLSTMPAFYLNWGRYTQLAGQVVLPAAALVAVWAATGARTVRGDVEAEASGRGTWWRGLAWRDLLVASVLAAGLFLTHYLVALFYALFLVAWLAVGHPGRRGLAAGERVASVARLAVVALLALVWALPWLPRFAAGPLGGHAVRMATSRLPDPRVIGAVDPAAVWRFEVLDHNAGAALLLAALVAGAWGLARRERASLVAMTWIVLLFVAAYPWLVGLPVTGLLKGLTVLLGLYVPAGLLIGAALADGMARLTDGRPFAARLAWAGALVLAGALAWKDADVALPDNALVSPDDVRAMAWVRDHTPADAVFLVSGVPAFGETVVVGEGAGWWLPLLAERGATVAPATVGTEHGFEPDYRVRLNRLAELWRADLDAPATQAALHLEGVTHAYVGARARRLEARGEGGGLGSRLVASARWELVYDEGEVRVFAYRPIGRPDGAPVTEGDEEGDEVNERDEGDGDTDG